MATKYVQGAGSWSTVQWWTAPSGGSTTTTPTTGDTAESNNFTVTIDANVTCDALQNTAGGTYSLTSGSRTLTTAITNTNATTTLAISSTGTTTINGNITGGTGIGVGSSGANATLIITGNLLGGTGATSDGLSCTNTTTVTVVGNVTGGSALTQSRGITFTNGVVSTLTITGTVTGGTSTAGGTPGAGVGNNAAGTWIINGNVFGGSGSGTNPGMTIGNGVGLTINGNTTGGTGTGTNAGLSTTTNGSVTITGTSTGGTSTGASVSSPGVSATGTGAITIQGGAIAGASGNISNVGINSTGSSTVIIQAKLTYGATGIAPTAGKVFLNYTTASTITTVNSSAATTIFVHPSATVTPPANGDVRFGVSFNAGNNTGTLRVPSASSVANTVATDNTTGTAVLTVGSALPTSPTANTVGEALFFADIFGNRVSTAQAGSSTTITLDAGASSSSLDYVGDMIYLYGGTGGGIRGSGQYRTIVSYNGSTKVATVDRAWGTNPDNTTQFVTIPQGLARAAYAV